MKIVIGINSLSVSSYPAYSNHIGLFYRLGYWAAKGGHEICLVNPARMSIDRMRNLCAKTALQIQADYLLFIDDDVLIPADQLMDRLIKADADIIAGDVIIRGYPFNHMAFIGDKTSLVPIANIEKEIEKQGKNILDVGAVGFSLCLIKREVLEKVSQPWFITGLNNTEDISFCLKAKEFIPDLKIKLHTEVQCGHILWEEIITRSNKKDYTIYMESQNPALVEDRLKQEVAKLNPSGDRGNLYLQEMNETLSKVEMVKND